MENVGCGISGVWKMGSVENEDVSRFYREFIIMLSVMTSIFYLPIRYCSFELQRIIVRFSRENVRMHPVFKEFRSIVNS